VKVFFSNLKLGLAKKNAGARAPEDRQADGADVSEDAVKTLDRARRIISNDQENIPYMMALTWGAYFIMILANAEDGFLTTHIILYAVFVAARILHTVVYSFELSLPRSIFFMVGLLSSLGIVLNAIITLISANFKTMQGITIFFEDEETAVKATIVMSLILWQKVIFSNFYSKYTEKVAGVRAPEDAQVDEEGIMPEVVDMLDRTKRIISNDQENIPYAMVLTWGALFVMRYALVKSGYNFNAQFNWHYIAHTVMFTLFVAARIMHTIFYTFGYSLSRSIVFLVGLLSSLSIVINAMIDLYDD